MGGKDPGPIPGKRATALESIVEKWGKKDLAKTTPKKEENKKTRGHCTVLESNPKNQENHGGKEPGPTPGKLARRSA